jgi:hypothetical protein
MRTAYEAAMERLRQEGLDAVLKLTKADKQKISAITDRYQSQIAERKIVLDGEMRKALRSGDPAEAQKLREQLRAEIADLQAKLEREKQRVIKAAQRRK